MSKNYLFPLHCRSSPDWKCCQRSLQNGKHTSDLFCLPEEAESLSDKVCRYHSAESVQRGALGKLKPHGGKGMYGAMVPASHHLAFGKLGIPRTSRALDAFSCLYDKGHRSFCEQSVCKTFVGLSALFSHMTYL